MGKMLHSDNAWTQASLWLVTAAFAAFLIGLGGNLLGRMWVTDVPVSLNQFIAPLPAARTQAALGQADAAIAAVRLRLEGARHRLGVAHTNTELARQNFDVWLAARSAEARPDQDAELISRTAELEQVRAAQRQSLAIVQAEEQALAQAGRQRDAAMRQWRIVEQAAMVQLEQARWMQQLRVFLYRLAITTPLVLCACWLFMKKRGSAYWPFIWGFISFAAFTFFVELIPYVPSYGGYVRYLVGIVVTVLVGRFAILSLQEGRDDTAPVARHPALLFDGHCPGCTRALDLREGADACGHCGLHLFASCPQCKTRKVAFARFCLACGAAKAPDQA